MAPPIPTPITLLLRKRARLDKILNVETSSPKSGKSPRQKRHARVMAGHFTKPTDVF